MSLVKWVDASSLKDNAGECDCSVGSIGPVPVVPLSALREVVGMLDAICHLLERSGLIENDGLIRDCTWHEFEMDRQKPHAVVTLRALDAC